jgi:cell division protein FtsL
MKKFIILLSIVTLITASFVWVRLKIVSISYDINSLHKKENELKESNQTLQTKINTLKSPERLEKIAKLYFNMNQPKPHQIITLESKTTNATKVKTHEP